MRWFWQRRRVPVVPPTRFTIHPTVDAAASWWQYTPSNADIIKHGGEWNHDATTDDAGLGEELVLVPPPDGVLAWWQLALIPAWQLDGRVDIDAALRYLRDELPASSVLAAGARPANRGPVLRKPRVVVEHGLDVRNTTYRDAGTPIYASVVADRAHDPLKERWEMQRHDEDCQSYQ
jgi:hypothetical protein